MPPRRPHTAFPFMLLAVGIGLTGYFGLQWFQLPTYSEADIDASTELNLQIDRQRQGIGAGDPRLEPLRAQTRAEIVADIQRERSQIETGLGAGLIALVAAFGNLVLMALMNRSRQ